MAAQWGCGKRLGNGGAVLKRSGEPCRYCVPGFAGRLTESENRLYLEALSTVKKQLLELSEFSQQLDKVAEWRNLEISTGASRNGLNSLLTTPKPAASWNVERQILKLELGSILLCSRCDGEGRDYAIIQKFLPQSLYAKAHGAVVVLAQGNDAVALVHEYVERARHTLRFMASDSVARAQEIAWKKADGRDVSRVVRAISDQFTEAVSQKNQLDLDRAVSGPSERHQNRFGFTRSM